MSNTKDTTDKNADKASETKAKKTTVKAADKRENKTSAKKTDKTNAKKTAKTTKTASEGTSAVKNRRNKKKGNVVRTVIVAVIVFAVAWFFGGKPMPKNDENGFHFEMTEYPLVYTIQETLKAKTDAILDKVVPDEKTSEKAADKDNSEEKRAVSSKEPSAPASVSQSTEEVSAQTSVSSSTSQITGSFSVKAVTGTTGSNAKTDQGHSENTSLFLGNPTDALADVSDNKNYLMEKKQYTVSYNTDTLQPNWVAWHLGSEDIGDADRSDNFRPDEELPQGWYEIKKADYQYNAYGFDRGHVCPSADRTATQEDNSMTFLMTNMVPQSPDNNRVIWMHFETYERQLVNEGNEVYIVAGPYGTGGTSGKGTFDSIPVKLKSGETLNMNVPAYTWKVCIVLPEGTDDISKINKDTTTIAINVPNQMGMAKTGDWEQYLTSIDEIESLTGYDFFELLPDDVEDVLESKVYVYNK